jgi:uncharacterized membrane protein
MPAVIAIHTCFALCALAIGPVALWTRLGARPRLRGHRAAGYAWVTCMVGAAVSALFIHTSPGPTWAGFSLIHLLVPFTLAMLWHALACLRRGQIRRHRQAMQRLYLGGCVVAGAFTLLPGRTLGRMVWGAL